jgi:hypothetical protein
VGTDLRRENSPSYEGHILSWHGQNRTLLIVVAVRCQLLSTNEEDRDLLQCQLIHLTLSHGSIPHHHCHVVVATPLVSVRNPGKDPRAMWLHEKEGRGMIGG